MPDLQLNLINTVAQNVRDSIARSENDYKRQIESVANAVEERACRVILLAGPSASGKTTSANLIADAIRRQGHTALVVSLDDFYLNSSDPAYPKNADGTRNFECPEALDLPEIRRTVGAIADGKPFSLPKFDFKVAGRVSMTAYPAITDGCVIVEGLHALNPLITSAIEGKNALRLFVSLSTNIHIGNKRILSGKKLRFLRRLVRDYKFRAADAALTLSLWKGVLDGENRYLYPYRNTADRYVDTFHLFEPGVLKPLALPLLVGSPVEGDEYVQKILRALEKIDPVASDPVPEDSLIREFIGGGIYEHLY